MIPDNIETVRDEFIAYLSCGFAEGCEYGYLH